MMIFLKKNLPKIIRLFNIKRWAPRGLMSRSFLIIVIPFLILQLILGWIFYDRHWANITYRLTQTVSSEISLSITQIEARPKVARQILDTIGGAVGMRFILKPGAKIPKGKQRYNRSKLLDRLMKRGLDARLKYPYRITSSGLFQEMVIIDIDIPQGMLTVIVPRKRLFSATSYIFIMWMVGASIILLAIAAIFMRNQIRPIRHLAAAVDRFGKGQGRTLKLKTGGAFEVRQATTAFNLMAERIRRQIRQRTDMLSGVSHDLRTPITRMKLQLALLDDKDVAYDLRENLEEMEHMITAYLTFARGEAGEGARLTDISWLFENIMRKWHKHGVPIETKIESHVVAWVRPNAISRAIDNLISNATRYGDKIQFTVSQDVKKTTIMVEDNGPGIPFDKRQTVFQPFKRLEESRNVETGGTGLGLAIALDIAHIHGGSLVIEDSPLGGVRARLTLPR